MRRECRRYESRIATAFLPAIIVNLITTMYTGSVQHMVQIWFRTFADDRRFFKRGHSHGHFEMVIKQLCLLVFVRKTCLYVRIRGEVFSSHASPQTSKGCEHTSSSSALRIRGVRLRYCPYERLCSSHHIMFACVQNVRRLWIRSSACVYCYTCVRVCPWCRACVQLLLVSEFTISFSMIWFKLYTSNIYRRLQR